MRRYAHLRTADVHSGASSVFHDELFGEVAEVRFCVTLFLGLFHIQLHHVGEVSEREGSGKRRNGFVLERPCGVGLGVALRDKRVIRLITLEDGEARVGHVHVRVGIDDPLEYVGHLADEAFHDGCLGSEPRLYLQLANHFFGGDLRAAERLLQRSADDGALGARGDDVAGFLDADDLHPFFCGGAHGGASRIGKADDYHLGFEGLGAILVGDVRRLAEPIHHAVLKLPCAGFRCVRCVFGSDGIAVLTGRAGGEPGRKRPYSYDAGASQKIPTRESHCILLVCRLNLGVVQGPLIMTAGHRFIHPKTRFSLGDSWHRRLPKTLKRWG